MRALLLLLIATTAMASPRAGVEREVAPQTPGRYYGYAFKATTGFMIWIDNRAQSHTLAFGSPIEPSSKPFVPEGIPLFLNPSMESQADAVVAVDEGWVVAWREDSTGYTRRIDASGAFVGSPVALYPGIYAPITISKAGSSLLFTTEANTDPALLTSFDLREVRRIELPQSFYFAITSSGDDHVLFFDDRTAMRIGPDGIVETIRVAFPHRFVVAYTGRDYLLVYGVAGAIFARRLSSDLRTLGDEFRIVLPQGHAATNPSVRPAATPGEALVNWTEIVGNCHTTIRADNRVDTPLCVLGPPVGPLPPPPPPLTSFAAQLMFAAPRDGSDGPFLYIEKDDFESRVTDGAGTALSPNDRFAEMPAIATHDRGGLAVWMEQGPGTRNLAGRILGGSGDRFVIGPGNSEWTRWNWFTANSYRGGPSVVWSGQLYFVAWTAGSRIAHARILENGTVLDTELQRIDPIHWGDGQTNPVATRVGDKILLVWTEGSRGGCAIVCSDLPAKVRAARFTLDGQLIDTRVIASEPYSTFADVTTNGDTALIAWQHEQRIYARRMTSSGFVFEPTRFLVGAGTRPSVARHGDGFVVTWELPTSPRGGPQVIFATHVSRDGVVGDPFLVSNHTWQPNGPFAWTMPDGSAAIAYGRMSHGSGLVPRLYYRSITNDASSRTRAVRR